MAKSAQGKPSDININLLKGAESSTGPGQVVSWLLNVGRYLIIITEIVALAIFLLSIKLSVDKNSLRDDIGSLSTQVAAQEKFENEFRNTAKRINEVKRLKSSHFQTNKVLAEFLNLLPKDMVLTSFKIGGEEFGDEQLDFAGEFKKPEELQTLVLTFSSSPKIVGLDIKELTHPNEENPNFTFTATAQINKAGFFEKAESK